MVSLHKCLLREVAEHKLILNGESWAKASEVFYVSFIVLGKALKYICKVCLIYTFQVAGDQFCVSVYHVRLILKR